MTDLAVPPRIDVHGHVSAPGGLYEYKANILSHRGAHGRGQVRASDDQIREAVEAPNPTFGNRSHLEHLDSAGVDIQLISPRPYTMMHSESPKLVRWFMEETNDMIHRICQLYPDRFRGVCGLPQSVEVEPAQWMDELRRCVTELGFVGALVNPDPLEGLSPPKPMGDRYWYPVYEALCELDVPGIVHSAGCREPARESYSLHFIIEETIAVASLMSSEVFSDFPDLKLIVCHGGGAIPYQVGRFKPAAARSVEDPTAGPWDPFAQRLRQLWFDTCLYTPEAISLLLRTVGTDRCCFGTEKPGTGSQYDPRTGRWFDDIHLLLDGIEWLSDDDRAAIYSYNAQSLFKRM